MDGVVTFPWLFIRSLDPKHFGRPSGWLCVDKATKQVSWDDTASMLAGWVFDNGNDWETLGALYDWIVPAGANHDGSRKRHSGLGGRAGWYYDLFRDVIRCLDRRNHDT